MGGLFMAGTIPWSYIALSGFKHQILSMMAYRHPWIGIVVKRSFEPPLVLIWSPSHYAPIFPLVGDIKFWQWRILGKPIHIQTPPPFPMPPYLCSFTVTKVVNVGIGLSWLASDFHYILKTKVSLIGNTLSRCCSKSSSEALKTWGWEIAADG